MLKEHLKRTTKRTARISRTVLSTAPKRKGTHWIAYVFLCIVMVIVIILLIVTYDFSIHQPSLDRTNLNEPKDVIILGSNDVSSNDVDTNNMSSNDVSPSALQQWPLETSNGAECEAIFGNGYSKEIISCSTDLSHFKCIQNPFSNQIYCEANNFIINPSLIKVSNGGEDIASVAGRIEGHEFPTYNHDKNTGDTALNIDCKPKGEVPQKNGISYYFHDIIEFMRSIDIDNKESIYHKKYLSDYNQLCKDNKKVTIFLITMRYEYANMYHQATDWYNFYQIIHALGIDPNGANYDIIFLDGHAKSQIDEAWQYGINSKYSFVKTLNNGQPICLKKAIFVSAGYVGGISLRTVEQNDCKRESKYVQNFGRWFLKGFGIKTKTERRDNKISITLTCRKDYVAHPRNIGGKASRKFVNDREVEDKIRDAVRGMNDIEVNIRNIGWSDYSFKEQLEIAASTDILIGAHGAGLSHVLFLPPKSGLIEIVPAGFNGEEHFKAFSQWNGHKYNHVMGGSEFKVNPHTELFKKAIREQIDFVKNNVY